ncbi:uncharacterized protein LOC143280359 [Babylonia areolata]|uniref:uncharacterized protein LOC143280359 n=1 Tax=Babylonia areolata TaxID=304850 RepID=UPI003FD4226D
MESPASIRDSIRQGDWAVSIDLTDAYFYILVHPRDRKWLRFSWEALRSKGIRLRVYLDDWLILAESKALCQHHLNLVRNQCQALGFLMNTEKSELEPSQQFEFLGMHFLPHVSRRSILLCTDNTTVACYLNKQGGAHSHQLSLHAETVLLWCQEHNIHLTARHVPGKLNILADYLSRSHTVLQTEWSLSHSTLQPIWDHWHKPHVDLFATRFNFRIPTYVSPVPDPQAWAVDTLSISWSNLSGYAFPPLPIMGKVLRKARLESAALILIAPHWPAQPWFPDLLHLTHVLPLRLHIGRHSSPARAFPTETQRFSTYTPGYCAGISVSTRRLQ